MAVLRSILLRFAFHYPICVLVLWAITGREWGGPGAVAAALFATIITTIQARHARALRRPPPPPVAPAAATGVAKICDQLNNAAWLRANGMMLTAALLDTIHDLGEYTHGQRTPDPQDATPPPGVAFNYPCGCTVSALTKGGHIVIPCTQHREGSASPAEPPRGMTFEEFRTAQRKPCGCVVNASGPAYPGAPHAVHTTTIPCLQHRGSRTTTTLLLWPPSPDPPVSRETPAQETDTAEELDVMILHLGRALDEALDRDHGPRRMGTR